MPAVKKMTSEEAASVLASLMEEPSLVQANYKAAQAAAKTKGMRALDANQIFVPAKDVPKSDMLKAAVPWMDLLPLYSNSYEAKGSRAKALLRMMMEDK